MHFPISECPDYRQIGPAVEPCVVYAIVRQESAFNPRVVSSANAIGLMQVTPAAGRDTAKRFNVTFDQHRLSQDVAYNAQLGTAELGNDIANWRGSYILAFVAYNAGPRRAESGSSNTAIRVIPRSIRSIGSSAFRFPRHAITSSACSRICRSIARLCKTIRSFRSRPIFGAGASLPYFIRTARATRAGQVLEQKLLGAA